MDRIILVYAADSGRLNALKDSLKKAFGRSACALCDLTHGLAGERGGWRECKAELGFPVEYLHRDELAPGLARIVRGKLPCVLGEKKGRIVFLLGPQDIRACQDASELKRRIIGA